MATDVVSLQTQVESVLGALVKAATVELTKLFESRYGVSTLDASVGRSEGSREQEALKILDSVSSEDTKRSVGVQVDADVYLPLELCGCSELLQGGVLHCKTSEGMNVSSPLPHIGSTGPPLLSSGNCLRDFREEEESLIPPEILLAEDNNQADPEWLTLDKEDAAMTVEAVESSVLEAQPPADGEPKTEVVLHGTWTDGDKQSSPHKQKPLVVHPDTHHLICGEKIKFVCPLILKPESPAPKLESPEKPAQVEPQPACVSTAKGVAYSPSSSDGAVTPAQLGIWEWVHTQKEADCDLQMKLKLSSPDQKLLRPCAVQLVNILTVPKSETMHQEAIVKDHHAKHKTGWPLPKDLRQHQGLHTGHRLCCFTPCGDGVWRLQKVVTHTREGYVCNICNKTFKRRKILRRHERFHTGEKPYSCSVCPKTFALRKSLRRHVRFHTGERPHNCIKCGKSFRLRDNLKAHLRFHTGEKPFSCATCGKTFRIMRNMEKHVCTFFVPSFRTIAGL